MASVPLFEGVSLCYCLSALVVCSISVFCPFFPKESPWDLNELVEETCFCDTRSLLFGRHVERNLFFAFL
jgi:hypothetical protein